jgi:NAD(P)-dependent dehydrogenase (short-subunit alcohol dehydrogenase family)
MEVANATVFITGANRGLGLAFAREARRRGARKVYAGRTRPSKPSMRTRHPEYGVRSSEWS